MANMLRTASNVLRTKKAITTGYLQLPSRLWGGLALRKSIRHLVGSAYPVPSQACLQTLASWKSLITDTCQRTVGLKYIPLTSHSAKSPSLEQERVG